MNPEEKRTYDKAWWLAHPEYKKEYRKTHPEHKRESARKWHRANREKRRGYALKSGYGMSLEQYHEMWTQQKGLCAVCGKPETRVVKGITHHLSVDHWHLNPDNSGPVRGLLCAVCNSVLGIIKDDIERLKNMALYLESCSQRLTLR